MKQLHIVITSGGDGSNSLLYFKETQEEKLEQLDEITGDYERFSSGDGVQIKTLTFPDDFDLDTLGISWWSDDIFEEYN